LHFSLIFDQPLFFLASVNLTIAAFAWRLFDTSRPYFSIICVVIWPVIAFTSRLMTTVKHI
jgi:hypothetical protein